MVTTQHLVNTTVIYNIKSQCRNLSTTSTNYSFWALEKRKGTKTHFWQYFFVSYITTCIALMNFMTVRSRIFWLENTAPPLREDHWVKLKKDWRTYHRLLLFNSIAMHEAGKLNATMTVIPAFRSTLAFFDKICDCAHYPISGINCNHDFYTWMECASI